MVFVSLSWRAITLRSQFPFLSYWVVREDDVIGYEFISFKMSHIAFSSEKCCHHTVSIQPAHIKNRCACYLVIIIKTFFRDIVMNRWQSVNVMLVIRYFCSVCENGSFNFHCLWIFPLNDIGFFEGAKSWYLGLRWWGRHHFHKGGSDRLTWWWHRSIGGQSLARWTDDNLQFFSKSCWKASCCCCNCACCC